MDVHTLTRKPRRWLAASVRMSSSTTRPRQYPLIYRASTWPGAKDILRSSSTSARASNRHQTDSYRKVGWSVPRAVGDRASRGLVPLVDGQAPGQIGAGAVELVVEPVAPSADRLRHGHARDRGIREGQERDAGAAAAQPSPERTQGDGTPDAQPALPDVERA